MSVYVRYINKAIRLLRDRDFKKEEYKKKLLNFVLAEIENSRDRILERNAKYLKSLEAAMCQMYRKGLYEACYSISVETKTRLLVDASSPMGWLIDEVGLAWDFALDTPYIPASSIKGVLRTALTVLYKLKQTNVDPDLLFGSTTAREAGGRISLITITDAYPIKVVGKLVEADVISPTYAPQQDKIMEHKAKPIPIYFLAVPPKVTFKFLIAVRKGAKKLVGCELEKLIRDVVKYAFEELGVGAKTSSSYGLFNEPKIVKCCEGGES